MNELKSQMNRALKCLYLETPKSVADEVKKDVLTYTGSLEGRMDDMSGCFDCGREYGSDNGFPDLIISNEAWRQISPTKDNGGLLCPSCICKRLHDEGITSFGAFMSGPIENVTRIDMYNFRWNENIRERLDRDDE